MISDSHTYDARLRDVHLAESAASLPGPDYYSVLRWIHDILRPASYVEIGVRRGASLKTVSPGTVCVAIDPEPQLETQLAAKCDVYRMKSDEFFVRHDLRSVLGEPCFHLAFIDGQHLFEQALRDFVHLERFAGPDSMIMIHDCLPLNEITSERTRTTHFYSGDVWKLALCLREHRPKLDMVSIPTPPTGLSLVRALDPNDHTFSDEPRELIERYVRLDFAHYREHPERMPPFIENNRSAVEQWLRPSRA